MNIVTKLTFARLCLSPLFIPLYFLGELRPELALAGIVAAWVLALLFEISDVLDGYLARRYGWVTKLGIILDPLADSVSRLTVFLCFVGSDIAPIWMVAIFLYRDSLVAGLRIVAASQNILIAARRSGKVKAVVQAGAIQGVLIAQIVAHLWPQWAGAGLASFRYGLLLAAAIVTVYSAIDYIAGNWPSPPERI